MRFAIQSRAITRVAAAFSLFACAVASAESSAQRAAPDLLVQPSQANVRAVHSVQLSVARAGNRLVSVGERGLVLLSDDNGHSWRQAKSVPVSVALTQVQFVSDTLGWAVGHSGVVLHSADGGETWQRQLDGRDAARIIAENAQRLAASGGEAAAHHLREAQALVNDGPDKPFLAVHFADALHGWVVGAYGIALETRDGGKTWESIMPRIPNTGGKHLYSVRSDASSVVIAGEQGVLFRSSDGGASFQRIQTPYTGTFFGSLPLGAKGILAFGLRGNVWRSDDGTNWSRVELPQPVTLTAGVRLADGSLMLGDESGRLLRGDSAATRFVSQSTTPSGSLTAMTQAADGALVVSGARGVSRLETATLTAEVQK